MTLVCFCLLFVYLFLFYVCLCFVLSFGSVFSVCLCCVRSLFGSFWLFGFIYLCMALRLSFFMCSVCLCFTYIVCLIFCMYFFLYVFIDLVISPARSVFPCFVVELCLCVSVYLFLCLFVYVFLCFLVSVMSCVFVSVFMCVCFFDDLSFIDLLSSSCIYLVMSVLRSVLRFFFLFVVVSFFLMFVVSFFLPFLLSLFGYLFM